MPLLTLVHAYAAGLAADELLLLLLLNCHALHGVAPLISTLVSNTALVEERLWEIDECSLHHHLRRGEDVTRRSG